MKTNTDKLLYQKVEWEKGENFKVFRFYEEKKSFLSE